VTEETTTPDTTNSPSEPPVAAPAAEAATPTEGAKDEAAPASDGETSVLGGDVEADKADDTAADADVTPAGPPEKYELAAEGVEIDPAMLEEATPILRALNLNNDQANQLIPVAAKLVTQTQEKTLQALVDAGAAQRKDWFDAFVADPDIGGARREETEHLAAKGMDALGYAKGHPFRVALTESGFGNHPDMIRAFRALGEMTGEDGSFVRSNDGVKEGDALTELYPNNRRSKQS
jgi:hypothetical protein